MSPFPPPTVHWAKPLNFLVRADTILWGHVMRIAVIVGDDGSVQRALGELVQRAFVESGCGHAIVVTATTDADLLRALSRDQVDLVVANYQNDSRGLDLFEWLQHGKFSTRTVLVTCDQLVREAAPLRAKGVDAVVKRPARVEDFKTLLADWFR